MLAAALILQIVVGYAVTGLVFAVWFVIRGVGRVDPVAAEGTRGFRVLIIPGVAALWPVMLIKLIGAWSAGRRRR